MYSLQYSLYLAHRWYSLVPRVYHEEVSTLQRAKKMTQQRQEQFWFSIFVWCSSHISQPTTRELTVENCTVVVHVFPPYYEKNPRKNEKIVQHNMVEQSRWTQSLFMFYDSNTYMNLNTYQELFISWRRLFCRQSPTFRLFQQSRSRPGHTSTSARFSLVWYLLHFRQNLCSGTLSFSVQMPCYSWQLVR